MTAQLELERILDEFLGEGTDELSDHVLEAALGDVTHTQQRRAWRVPRRFSDMPTPVRLLAVAAVLAAALGGAFILGGTLTRESTPEPAPQPIPTAVDDEPLPIGVDPAGRYSAHRGAAFGWAAGDVGLHIPGSGSRALVASGPDGRDILVGTIQNTGNRATLSATDRCPEPGTYDWALTQGSLAIELTPVEDRCEERSALLAGAWNRVSIQQLVAPGRRYGLPVNDKVLSFTLPSAFRDVTGIDPTLEVELDQSGGRWHGFDGDSDTLHFSIATFSPPYAYFDRCDDRKGRGGGPTTIEEFLAWNRGTQGATVSEPRATTVAGRDAVVVDITVGSDCPNGDEAYGWWDGLTSGMTQRQWAVDIGGRLIIVGFSHQGPGVPLTPEQLDIADEFVASISYE
jgi:hypothetical protein